MLAMGIKMAQPLLNRAYQEGRARLSAHLVILVGSALLLGIGNASPITALLFAGVISSLLLAVIPVPEKHPVKADIQ